MITLLKPEEEISSAAEEIKPKGPRFFMGLDLGQASDHSAFSIIEESGEDYLCRHLERWPVRTHYADVAADVARMVNSPELQSDARHTLAVDMNGPGRPFLDLLSAHTLNADVAPIFSHGGDRVIQDGGEWRVPKRLLVSRTKIALEQRRLKIAPSRWRDTLVREMLNYEVKISEATAHDSYGAWRTGQHDDLLFAVMLPLFMATAPRKRMAFA